MRIICDAPGQTCNRLWSYAASIAECIVKKKRLMIIFYDWTIEDFPNLLHCPWIYFPLWHKWYLERGNGWNNYKGLTWKVCHNKTWDSIFKFFGCKKGWWTRRDKRYLQQVLPDLQRIYRPKEEIMEKAGKMVTELRRECDFVVGVHIRRGDYATWNDGRFFYSLEEYHQFMLRLQASYSDRHIGFFICSNEDFPLTLFEGCNCRRFGKEPSGAILDLYTLTLCDRIIGPFSSYSRWASFIGKVPLCFLETKQQEFSDEDFSRIVDYFHFENGKEILDW
jgi:hypothetical protein